MKYDSIVIGSGLGGLTAAAKLAKEGEKVLVIEQHSISGGCATSFTRQNYTIDVGLHSLDGVYAKGPKLDIFNELDVFMNVEFVKDETGFYRFYNERVDITIPDDPEELITVLSNYFPEEKKGIEEYVKTIIGISDEVLRVPSGWKMKLITPFFPIFFPKIFKWYRKTAGEMLDSMIRNKDLKLVILGNMQSYGDNPYQLSALIFSTAQAAYLKGGSHYIKGSSQKLSNHLADFIRQHDGEFLFSNLVTKIIISDGKAVGVEYRPTLDENSEVTKIYAENIIANASVPQVVENLLPETEKEIMKEQTDHLVIANSQLTLYLGFSKTPKELGNKNYATFYYDPQIKSMADIVRNQKGTIANRKFTFIDYSQLNSGLAPVGKSVAQVCTPDYLKDWENLSDEEYYKKKEEVIEILMERLNLLVPGIKEHIEYKELATPKTIKKFTLNTEGSAFGWAQLPNQSSRDRLSVKSSIPGLYFASAWTFPGGRITGVIGSGWECAETILRSK